MWSCDAIGWKSAWSGRGRRQGVRNASRGGQGDAWGAAKTTAPPHPVPAPARLTTLTDFFESDPDLKLKRSSREKWAANTAICEYRLIKKVMGQP